MTTTYASRGSPDDPSYSAYERADSTLRSPDMSLASSVQDEETRNVLALEEEQDMEAAIRESLRQFQVDADARAQRIVGQHPVYSDMEYPTARSDSLQVSESPIAGDQRTILPSSMARRVSHASDWSSERDVDFSWTSSSTVSARDFDSKRSPEAEMILQSSGYRRGEDTRRHVAFHLDPDSSSTITDSASISSRSDIESVISSSPSSPVVDYFRPKLDMVPASPSPTITNSPSRVVTPRLEAVRSSSTRNQTRPVPANKSPIITGREVKPHSPFITTRDALITDSLSRASSPFRTPNTPKPESLPRPIVRPPLTVKPSFTRSPPSERQMSGWKVPSLPSPSQAPSPPQIWHPKPRAMKAEQLQITSRPLNASHSPKTEQLQITNRAHPNTAKSPPPEFQADPWMQSGFGSGTASNWEDTSHSPRSEQFRSPRTTGTRIVPEWAAITQPATPPPRQMTPQRAPVNSDTLRLFDSPLNVPGARVSVAESDVGSDIGIIKHSPPGSSRVSVTSSLPVYSLPRKSSGSVLSESQPPSYHSDLSTMQSGPSRLPMNGAASGLTLALNANGFPVDKKEKVSSFSMPADFEDAPDTMTALSAEHFRMHESTDIFSDETVCPTCNHPLIYGEDGNAVNLNVKDLLKPDRGEAHLEKILRRTCPHCSRSYCRGCSKSTDMVCLAGDTCARKCSCAVFEILGAYDRDVLKHIGNSGDYERYLDQEGSEKVFCATIEVLMAYLDPTVTRKTSKSDRRRRSDGNGPVPNVAYLVHLSLLSNVIRHLLSKTSYKMWFLLLKQQKMYRAVVTFLTGMIYEWGYAELALLRVAEVKTSCGLRKWMHQDGEIDFGDLQPSFVTILQPFTDPEGTFMTQAKGVRGDIGKQLCNDLVSLSEAVRSVQSQIS